MTVSVNRKKVWRRLGRGLKTETTAGLEHIFEEQYRAALAAAKIECIIAKLEIKENDGKLVLLKRRSFSENDSLNVRINSVSVASLFSGCHEAYAFCITLGKEISETISRLSAEGETVRALIMDSTGSELVEEAADEACRYIERHFAASLTRRYSPGYGDWSLEGQAELDKALDIGRIGVTINDSFLMIPEKTITAVAGVI